jgi:hypothetical protein
LNAQIPRRADPKDYSSLAGQQAAEERRKVNESRPGVMVFRRSERGVDPYGAGLVVSQDAILRHKSLLPNTPPIRLGTRNNAPFYVQPSAWIY